MKQTISLIFIIIISTSCSRKKDNNQLLNHLDKEITNRISFISNNIDLTITNGINLYFDPIKFDNRINEENLLSHKT